MLLLPGALATAAFYDDLLADPELSDASIRFVATTLPGFGGTPAPDDVSMENYARLAGYCLQCDVRFACHGGCPKDRFVATPDGEPGLNYLCAGFKEFFHHVDKPMRIMSQLLAQHRAPAEIAQLYASEDAKRGRNDPCTCGSGRKWKHCHGASLAA